MASGPRTSYGNKQCKNALQSRLNILFWLNQAICWLLDQKLLINLNLIMWIHNICQSKFLPYSRAHATNPLLLNFYQHCNHSCKQVKNLQQTSLLEIWEDGYAYMNKYAILNTRRKTTVQQKEKYCSRSFKYNRLLGL